MFGGEMVVHMLRVGDASACIRPLLKALDDPNRIGAAHFLLIVMTAPAMRDRRIVASLPESIRLDCNGLEVEIWPNGASPHRPVELQLGQMFRLDPTCFDSVWESWHRRLDARFVYLPPWVLPLIAAEFPSVLVLRTMRRHAATRRGCCWSCGYNLL
jgi:hypothetical protein